MNEVKRAIGSGPMNEVKRAIGSGPMNEVKRAIGIRFEVPLGAAGKG
jgi:hypothetical protein